MKNVIATAMLLCGLCSLQAATYTVSFSQDVTVAGQPVKAGRYQLETGEGNQVTLRNNKTKLDLTANASTVDKKFAESAVRYENKDGQNHVTEIMIGGTKTKLSFAN